MLGMDDEVGLGVTWAGGGAEVEVHTTDAKANVCGGTWMDQDNKECSTCAGWPARLERNHHVMIHRE